MSFNISNDSKIYLLNSALSSILSKFGLKVSININIPQELSFNAGCFVTLNKNGNLRGCIGNFRNDINIVDNVKKMAVEAAFNDYRFNSLESSEIELVDIEISILSPMVEVDEIESLVVGRDGIFIRRNLKSGVLLPQVAVEYGWDIYQFLSHTCLKAGLNSDCWEQYDTKIYRFEALIFSKKNI